MHTIDLVAYIRHGMMVKNIAEHHIFDAIIYESLHTKVVLPENIIIHTLDTTNIHDIHAQLIAYHEHYTSILVVIDSLHLHDILPSIQASTNTPSDHTITYINLGTGISGITNKGSTEMHDVALAMEYGMDVYEPFDFVSCFSMLEQSKHHTYIRIPALEYPSKLQDITWKKEQQSIAIHHTNKAQGTILCHGAHLATVIQAHSMLDTGCTYDIFCLPMYQMPEDAEKIVTSITTTKHIYVILDQAETSTYIDHIQSRLFKQGIHDIEQLSILTPDTQSIHISPTLSIYEAHDFGPLAIARYLQTP